MCKDIWQMVFSATFKSRYLSFQRFESKVCAKMKPVILYNVMRKNPAILLRTNECVCNYFITI